MRISALLILLSTLSGCSVSSPEPITPQALQIEKIADGFRFTEGPAYGPDGRLYFSDIPNNRIHSWSPAEGVKIFREPSGNSNGLIFDSSGRLHLCQGGDRQLSRLEADGSLTVLADNFKGTRFNSPNDLWIHPNGTIYFTDPRYGKRDSMEMETEGVYLLNPDTGQVLRLVDDMIRPNGIVGTPDGKTLYITDHGASLTYKFPIKTDGSIGAPEWIIDRGSDGMALDALGNLYLTDGTIAIYSPTGEPLTEIELPENPANITFGGTDHKTLYATARTGVYAVKMNIAGAK